MTPIPSPRFDLSPLFAAKRARRRDLARLPMHEKIRIVESLRRRLAPVHAARERHLAERAPRLHLSIESQP